MSGYQIPADTYNPEVPQLNYLSSNINQCSTNVNTYNPFNSNPFMSQRSATNSESNTSFCYSVNNLQNFAESEATSQQPHSLINTAQKNSNSNLYSLFSTSNSSNNLASSTLVTAKNAFYSGLYISLLNILKLRILFIKFT